MWLTATVQVSGGFPVWFGLQEQLSEQRGHRGAVLLITKVIRYKKELGITSPTAVVGGLDAVVGYSTGGCWCFSSVVWATGAAVGAARTPWGLPFNPKRY